MTKFILLVLLFCSVLCSAQPLKNKKIIEKLFLEAWNQKNFSGLNHQATDTITLHVNNKTFLTTLNDLKGLVEHWHNSFRNFKFEVHQIIAEGNIVAVNVHYSGVQIKTFKGIEPKNKPIYVSEMMFFRFEKGKVVEAWEVYDELGMLNQMKNEN